MALKAFVLPVCDKCGEAWFPDKGPARDDPRKFDAEQRAKGLVPLRCGKCKSVGWDSNFTGDRRRKDPRALLFDTQSAKQDQSKRFHVEHRTPARKNVPAAVVEKSGAHQKCQKHRLLHCPQCSREKRH